MLVGSVVLFLIAAVFGLIVLTAILKNKPTPRPAIFAHGLVAVTALISVIVYAALGHTDTLLITSIVLFVMTALGGFTLFTINMRKKAVPKLLAIFHPILGVIALTTLIIYILQ